MDIQYVLDVYACAVYIVNYISYLKQEKAISALDSKSETLEVSLIFLK